MVLMGSRGEAVKPQVAAGLAAHTRQR
jgi:hypothetical protein